MSSKKCSSFWSACDYCNSIVNQRDLIVHKEKSCPPSAQSWIHPYILKNSLYSTVETFDSHDVRLQRIPESNKSDYILIPTLALQLCDIPIGDPVLVKPNLNECAPFIKMAFPYQEKTNFTVALSNEVLQLNLMSPKSQLTVSKFIDKISAANVVILSCEDSDCSLDLEPLLLKLKVENTYKILCKGNRLLYKLCGRKIIFEVINILPYENSEKLPDTGFYLISSETKFNFLQDTSKKKHEKKLIEKIGGLNDIIEEIKGIISFILDVDHDLVLDLNIGKGILIYGPIGTGKSTLMEAVGQYFTSNIIRIQSTKIFSNVLGETERELHGYFNKAKQFSSSLILIDDLDMLCSNSAPNLELERRITVTLALLMDSLNIGKSSVVVLATTSKIHHIDPMLRSSTRFGKEIEICVPNCSQRFDILKVLLSDVDNSLTEQHVQCIADLSHGFVGADLNLLVSKAVFRNYQSTQGEKKISVDDFLWAVTKIKPSAIKEIMIEVPNVRWEDIGGQEDLKLKLKQCVEWPWKYKDSFSRLGITPPKGLLMFGPPGCSKTMIAKALATESSLNFISVKGSELFNKWVGESEKAVRKVFKRARQAAPSIVFFDEIDAIGNERDTFSGSNVQERVLAQMLVELDGVEPLDNVTIIAATNRPDRIDPALLRPGRLDRIIYVPLPDYKTRREIIILQMQKSCFAEDVVANELAEMTEGYSCAEIVAVCKEAALKALEENINADNINRAHFMAALETVTPRTPKNLLIMYEKYLKK